MSVEEASMDGITRGMETVDTPDGPTEMRVYERDGVKLPSVTSVYSLKDTDTTGLDNWKRKYNGQNGKPDWRHIFWFSGHRGTLAHYEMLNPLADRELWSADEEGSVRALCAPLSAPQADEEVREAVEGQPFKKVAYSITADGGGVSTIPEFIQQYEKNLHDRWLFNHCQIDIAEFWTYVTNIYDALGISKESVVDVEKFVFSPKGGYAGQCDLVYDDPKTGERVLADLKTSGGMREKYAYQMYAYAAALPYDIDRFEVIRYKPGKGGGVICRPGEETTVHHSSRWWPRQHESFLDEFLSLAGKVEVRE